MVVHFCINNFTLLLVLPWRKKLNTFYRHLNQGTSVCVFIVFHHDVMTWNVTRNTEKSSWLSFFLTSLQWRHNVRDGVSNHQPHDCLLNRLFRHISKKASKLRVTGPHKGPVKRQMFPFKYVIMDSRWQEAFQFPWCYPESSVTDGFPH